MRIHADGPALTSAPTYGRSTCRPTHLDLTPLARASAHGRTIATATHSDHPPPYGRSTWPLTHPDPTPAITCVGPRLHQRLNAALVRVAALHSSPWIISAVRQVTSGRIVVPRGSRGVARLWQRGFDHFIALSLSR